MRRHIGVLILLVVAATIGVVSLQGSESGSTTPDWAANPAVAIDAEQPPSESRSTPRAADPRQRTSVGANSWSVRGTARLGFDKLFPGAAVRLRMFAGRDTNGEPIAETVVHADDDGAFEWHCDRPQQVVTIRAAAASPTTYSRADDIVAAPGSIAPAPLSVFLAPLDRVVSGVVKNEQGVPIKKARITNYLSTGPRFGDAQGRFELRVSSAYPTATFSFEARGYAHKRHTVAIPKQGQPAPIEITLSPGFRIFGQVRDENGLPVVGAVVRSSSGKPAITDAKGFYELASCPSGLTKRHHVLSSKPGFMDGVIRVAERGKEAKADLTMRTGGRVSGIVVGPDGKLLAGAKIRLGRGRRRTPTETTSLADGSFTLDVPPTNVQLMALYPGLAPASQRVAFSDEKREQTDVRMTLRQGHEVAGRVTNSKGQPVQGASVRAREGRVEIADCMTDAAGRYRLLGLPNSDLEVDVVTVGYVDLRKRRLRVDQGAVDFRITRAGALAGRVVDAKTGKPLRVFKVALFGEGRMNRRVLRFDVADGRWRMQRSTFTPGERFTLEISAPGYAVTVLRGVQATPDPAPDRTIARMRPGVRLTGRVLDRTTGSPIPGAAVHLLWPDRPSMRIPQVRTITQNSGARGDFAFPDLPSGSPILHVVVRNRPRHVHGTLQIPSSGRLPDLVVHVGSGGTIEGRVPGAKGGEKIWLSPTHRTLQHSPGVGRESRTSSKGTFRVAGLVNTRFAVTARTQDASGATTHFLSIVDAPATGAVRVDLTTAGSCGFRGKIKLPDDSSRGIIQIARVSDARAPGRTTTFQSPISDGRFHLRGLPAGTYRLGVFYKHAGQSRVWNHKGSFVLRSGTNHTAELSVSR